MITYVELIKVHSDGKYVGDIHKVKGGYQYFPKGQRSGGEIFPTVNEVKRSLEG